MASKKRDPKGAVFRFRIGAYKPETMPLSRLGEYLSELATLLGEPNAVHFQAIEEGSTVPLIAVDPEAVPKVRSRLLTVAEGTAPPEALRAQTAINRLLRDDNASGSLQEGRRVVFAFPGNTAKIDRPVSLRQHGSIVGELVRIGGRDHTIHATLVAEGRPITHIAMPKELARRLAPRLFEYVRLIGSGRWERTGNGEWTLAEFTAEAFTPLARPSLSEALGELRTIEMGWENVADPLARLKQLREDGGDIDARH